LARPDTAIRASALDVHLAAAPVLLQCCVNHFLRDELRSLLLLQPQATAELLRLFAELIHTSVSQPHRLKKGHTARGGSAADAAADAATTFPTQKKKKPKGPSHVCLADHIIATDEVFRRCCALLRGPALDASPGSSSPQAAATAGRGGGGVPAAASPLSSRLRPGSATPRWVAARAAARDEASYHALASTVRGDCGGPPPPPFNRLGHVALGADVAQALGRGSDAAAVYGKHAQAAWVLEAQRAAAPFGKYYPRPGSTNQRLLGLAGPAAQPQPPASSTAGRRGAGGRRGRGAAHNRRRPPSPPHGATSKSDDDRDPYGDAEEAEADRDGVDVGASGLPWPGVVRALPAPCNPTDQGSARGTGAREAALRGAPMSKTPPFPGALPATPLPSLGALGLQPTKPPTKTALRSEAAAAAEAAEASLAATRTHSQRLVDERGCHFLCRAVGAEPFAHEVPSHDAELAGPKLCRSGAVEALAAVTRRWPASGFGPAAAAGGADGRLAHHYAVNALVALAAVGRGKHRRAVAAAECGVALRQRLAAMEAHAAKTHNTEYSKQAAMAAIRDVLNQEDALAAGATPEGQ
jgi:hypothetical protein